MQRIRSILEPLIRTTTRPIVRQFQPLRQRLFVDPSVQGTLLIRFLLYALAGLLYLTIMQLYSLSMVDPESSWTQHGLRLLEEAIYWTPGLIVLLPWLIHDLLVVSNRFAGPMVRFRRHLAALSAGDPVNTLEFRDDDCWHELADDFNRLRAEVLRLRGTEPTELESPSPSVDQALDANGDFEEREAAVSLAAS